MVYDWDGKEEQCYKLYVEERRPLDEVMQIMKDQAGFAPSKRAFQTQFKRWDFPSKQNPAHKNAALVERTRELWERNTSQKDMLRILNEEGYDIKERELMRVRAKNRWLLRVPNGTKAAGGRIMPVLGSDGQNDMDSSALQSMEHPNMDSNNRTDGGTQGLPASNPGPSSESELSPEVRRKRQLRLEKLQAESTVRWATKKRRRRTRGYSGLPADPPGPPRFPSETTIDESKAYLKLDNVMYRELRDQFTRICEEAGFVKKTVAGPEKWRAAKDRLIAENQHLQMQFYQDPAELENKQLSLDVVCTDVTKRMRTLERRMTIAEAKNVLGINPEESRIIRTSFYDVLKADHFTSKLEAGDDHWRELKQIWIGKSELLQSILAPGDADPEHENKKKAMEVLCRDVMKRLRDDQTKKDPTRKKQVNLGPGPGPAPPRIAKEVPSVNYAAAAVSNPAPTATMTRKPAARSRNRNQNQIHNINVELQIDPSLLAAASDPSVALAEQLQHYASAGSNLPPNDPYSAQVSMHRPQSQPGQKIPVFFKLSSQSQFQTSGPVWLGQLSSASMADLRDMAGREHPMRGAGVLKVDGMVTNDDRGEAEIAYTLETDEELSGYLDFVMNGTGKPTFVVHLAGVGGDANVV